jgi:predicted nucleotidyltransferase
LLKIEADLENALRLLRDYFADKQIPFALVGALVPAILLSADAGIRDTRDADHVIKLTSWAEWETVIAGLVNLGFTRGRGEQEHRLYYRTAEIDLIPYGVTNGPEEVLTWRKSGNQMNMTGFSDVFKYANPTEISQGLTLPVIPLWLFVVLKVVAYLDRGLPRDLSDIAYALEHYESSGKESRRFEIASGVEGVTYETSGAYLLGRDIRENASAKAVELVKDFAGKIADEYHAVVNAILRQENSLASDVRRMVLFKLVEAFRKGLRLHLETGERPFSTS